MDKIIFILAVSGFISLFLKAYLEEDGLLHQLYIKWSYICPDWLRKPTLDCSNCISFWLAVIISIITVLVSSDYIYLFLPFIISNFSVILYDKIIG